VTPTDGWEGQYYDPDSSVRVIKGELGDGDHIGHTLNLVYAALTYGWKNMSHMNNMDAAFVTELLNVVRRYDSLGWESIEQEVKVGTVVITREPDDG